MLCFPRISPWCASVVLLASTASAQTELLPQSSPMGSVGDDVIEGAGFGRSVVIDESTLAIGAPSANDTGAVYVFLQSGTSWLLEAKLSPELPGGVPDGNSGDRFGFALDLEADTLVVGSPGHERAIDPCVPDPMNSNAECPDCAYGAAYVFTRSGTSWTSTQLILASDRDKLDQFGYSVAISADSIAVGAPFEDDFSLANCTPPTSIYASTCDSGAAYLFERSGTNWNEVAKLGAGSEAAAKARFGASLALDGSTLIVGAPRQSDRALPDQASRLGGAYVFDHDGTAWITQGTPLHDFALTTQDLNAFDDFGTSVAVHGDTIAVGAPGARANVAPLIETLTGAVHIFRRSSSSWLLEQRLAPLDGIEGARFGTAVALTAETLCVGAPYADGATVKAAGRLHVFSRVTEAWNEQATSVLSGATPFDQLGRAVTVRPGTPATAVASSWLTDSLGVEDAGSVWVLESETFLSFCSGSNGPGGCGACLCGNDAPAGTIGGCLNDNPIQGIAWSGGVGSSAQLIASGTATAGANLLSFRLERASVDSFAVLLSAPGTLPNVNATCPSGIGIPSVLLDGLRCIGMGVIRHATVPLDSNGTSVATGAPLNGWGPPNGPTQGVLAQAGVAVGQTRYFQSHYRTLPDSVCMKGQNTSNAVAITATP